MPTMKRTRSKPAAPNRIDLRSVMAALDRRLLELAESKSALRRGTAKRKEAQSVLRRSEAHSVKVLAESRRLRAELQDRTREVMIAQEEERRKMSVRLQDEVAQMLLALHMRLEALDKKLSISADEFKKEIAITQKLVQESLTAIRCFNHEFGIHHED
jgi:signal transduction histidine kinase